MVPPPTVSSSTFWSSDTLSTGTTTVTVQVAVMSLFSLLVAVMVAVPTVLAVTTPVLLTVATLVLLLLQLTALFEASAGKTVAVRVSDPSTFRVRAFLFSVTPVTAILVSTVTLAGSEAGVVGVVLVSAGTRTRMSYSVSGVRSSLAESLSKVRPLVSSALVTVLPLVVHCSSVGVPPFLTTMYCHPSFTGRTVMV